MAAYLPAYSEALELKSFLSEQGLSYVHFHDQCGYSYFSFDEPDEAAMTACRQFWQERGMDISISDDRLQFIVTSK